MQLIRKTVVEQIIGWSKAQFESFVVSEDNASHPEQEKCLDTIKKTLELEPMENSYEYVKAVQEQFDDSKIKFSNDYYDTLGLERPMVRKKRFRKLSLLP